MTLPWPAQRPFFLWPRPDGQQHLEVLPGASREEKSQVSWTLCLLLGLGVLAWIGSPTRLLFSPSRLGARWFLPWRDAAGHVSETVQAQGTGPWRRGKGLRRPGSWPGTSGGGFSGVSRIIAPPRGSGTDIERQAMLIVQSQHKASAFCWRQGTLGYWVQEASHSPAALPPPAATKNPSSEASAPWEFSLWPGALSGRGVLGRTQAHRFPDESE